MVLSKPCHLMFAIFHRFEETHNRLTLQESKLAAHEQIGYYHAKINDSQP